MNIHRAAHQKTFTTPNATITPLATPALGAQQNSVIRQHMAPSHQNPTHTQTHEEIMIMLQGSVKVTMEAETTELHAGDSLIIPAHTPHSISNHSGMDAEWLIVSPAAVQFSGPDGQPMTPDWAR